MSKCNCDRSNTNPTYNIHGGFTFPLDGNQKYGSYGKVDLEIKDIDFSIPPEEFITEGKKNHIVKVQRFLMEELDRQIEEVLDEAQ